MSDQSLQKPDRIVDSSLNSLTFPPSNIEDHLESITELANAALYQRGLKGQPDPEIVSRLAERTLELCRDLGVALPGINPQSGDELKAAFLKGILESASRPWNALHPDQISALTLGLVTLGVRSRSLIGSLASLAINQSERLSPEGLTILAWSCEISKLTERTLFSAIGDAASSRLLEFEEYEVDLLVASFNACGMRHDDLFSEIGYRAATTLPSFPTERMTKLMRSLNEGEAWETTLFNKLPTEISNRLTELNDHQLASIVRVFRKRDILEADLFTTIAQEILDRFEHGARFSGSDTAMLLEAFAHFAIDNPPLFATLGRRAIDVKGKLGKHLTATSAWALAVGAPELIPDLANASLIESIKCHRVKLQLHQALLIAGVVGPETSISGLPRNPLGYTQRRENEFQSRVAGWLAGCGVQGLAISQDESFAGYRLPIVVTKDDRSAIVECVQDDFLPRNYSPRGDEIVRKRLLPLAGKPIVSIYGSEFADNDRFDLLLKILRTLDANFGRSA